MKRSILFGVMALMLIAAVTVYAASGDLIQNVNLPVPGTGVSVAVDCQGTVYYTLNGDNNLYAMDKDGNLLSTTLIKDVNTGNELDIDEMAWDQSRQVLWGQLHGSNPVEVYHIQTTGTATHQWTSATNSIGSFRDGIAYDGTDDTIWISGDVSTTIEHYDANGNPLGSITPKNGNKGPLGQISGVIVGVGDMLYLGRNGAVQIVQVKKSDGTFIASFASPGGARDEGLECDPVNFAPKLALWSREFNSPGFMSVIEIEEGTCVCGGGAIEVPLDIKPTSCPNPLNTSSQGVLPVAILGTEDLDVIEIELVSLSLVGVSPIRVEFEDVATPVNDDNRLGEDCLDCTEAGPDGFMDLTLKFDKQEIVAAIEAGLVPGEELQDKECRVLTLTGKLKDAGPPDPITGASIVGKDIVRIQKKKAKKKKLLVPDEYALSQNAPNPFNPETAIEYTLPEEADVRLVIYNPMGQTVRTLVNTSRPAGHHQVIWDSRDDRGYLASGGVYFYRLTGGGFSETKRMILLR